MKNNFPSPGMKDQICKQEFDPVIKELLDNSNLPGPRGNIEYAFNFALMIVSEIDDRIIVGQLIDKLLGYDELKAPVNSPYEFLPFCGIILFAETRIHNNIFKSEDITFIRKAVNDKRWRMREASAMALQKYLDKFPLETITELQKWLDGNYAELRGVAAAIAEPRFMKDKNFALESLRIHKILFQKILTETDYRSEAFKIFEKGLSYTLSVVVAGLPDEGFKLIEELIETKHKIVLKIISENLKKNRLLKIDKEKVAHLAVMISSLKGK